MKTIIEVIFFCLFMIVFVGLVLAEHNMVVVCN